MACVPSMHTRVGAQHQCHNRIREFGYKVPLSRDPSLCRQSEVTFELNEIVDHKHLRSCGAETGRDLNS